MEARGAGADGLERLGALGQGRLLAHLLSLDDRDARRLRAEALAEDWALLRRAALEGAPPPPPELRPPPSLTLRRQQAVGGLRPRLAALGRRRLAEGKVATLLLAGGQGSRLGHPGPKGTFVLGPEPDRTLYALLAERVARAGRDAGRPVPLVLLTSDETDASTREAFADPARYGLLPGQVEIVVQRTLPVLDAEGRALLAAPDRLLRAPDGHGGAWGALERSGTLARLAEAGVEVLTTFQVDNPLAQPLDPVMLGWQAERRLEVLGKAVRRRSPEERVGMFARDLDGRLRIVEYSELGDLPAARELAFGSIAIHALDLPWLRSLPLHAPGLLPLHPARKQVRAFDPATGALRAEEAIKLERFLFDVFPHAVRGEVHEVEREREFAPIKNAQGADSPASAAQLVEAEVRRWHRERGLPEPSSVSLRPLEIDAYATSRG
jgi:UDP-N-acetylglucosamine/UDP-N-acetylgalactosamine diphosphorylase